MMPTIRVLVVEDHPLTRLGLATVLRAAEGIEVVGEADTMAKTFEAVRSTRSDVVVLDLRLPDGNMLGHMKRLREHAAGARLLVVTGAVVEEQARIALRDGASGFLSKEVDAAALVQAIRDVMLGRRVVGEDVRSALEDGSKQPSLSAREIEILGLVVEGFTNAEIGRAFGLSTGTVRTHVSNIFAKLGVTDRTEAASLALRRGLV